MATEKIDPARSMALLWGQRDRPNRGPKPGLTVDGIVRAAIKVADTEGISALSMRRVAETLGVGTMSLYTYVPAKAELFELMVDAVIDDTAAPPAEPGEWRAWLERFARDSFEGYRRHPWLLEVPLTRGLMGPNQTAALESVLGTVMGAGLNHGESFAVVQLVVGYVRGVARNAIDSAQLEQRTGVTDEQWWLDVGPLFDRYIDADRFPTLTAAFSDQNWDTWVDPFEFGLQRVLDGIEAYVNSRSAS